MHLQCQNNWLVLRDNDRMLELSGNGSIHGAQRPAIFFFDDATDACGQKWLDCQDQPVVQNSPVGWVIEVEDLLWILVQLAPDAMSRQIVDDIKPAPPRFVLDRAPDSVQEIPRLRRVQRLGQRAFRCLQELFQIALALRDDH